MAARRTTPPRYKLALGGSSTALTNIWRASLASATALLTLDVSAILSDKFGMDGAHLPKDPAKQIALLNEKGHQLSEYTDSAEIHAEIEAQVMEFNKQFAPPEQIKKFTILPRDFTVDDGELTPTLKIRRIQITENWTDEIEQMYA